MTELPSAPCTCLAGLVKHEPHCAYSEANLLEEVDLVAGQRDMLAAEVERLEAIIDDMRTDPGEPR